jgi:hypothetical protein
LVRCCGSCRRECGSTPGASFDNDAKVHAPYDAIALAERLGSG